MKIILASGSPARLKMLQDAFYNPDHVISPSVEEVVIKGETPSQMSSRLANQKMTAALSIAKELNIRGEYLIITADTVSAVGRHVIDKARCDQDVFNSIEKLSGRNHSTFSSCSVKLVSSAGEIKRSAFFQAHTRVKVKNVSRAELDMYVKSKIGIGKSGAFSVDFGSFVSNVSGEVSVVKGLPLRKLVDTLSSFGAKRSL